MEEKEYIKLNTKTKVLYILSIIALIILCVIEVFVSKKFNSNEINIVVSYLAIAIELPILYLVLKTSGKISSNNPYLITLIFVLGVSLLIGFFI